MWPTRSTPGTRGTKRSTLRDRCGTPLMKFMHFAADDVYTRCPMRAAETVSLLVENPKRRDVCAERISRLLRDAGIEVRDVCSGSYPGVSSIRAIRRTSQNRYESCGPNRQPMAIIYLRCKPGDSERVRSCIGEHTIIIDPNYDGTFDCAFADVDSNGEQWFELDEHGYPVQ